MRRLLRVLSIASFALVVPLGAAGPTAAWSAGAVPPLAGVRSFGYQLQGEDIARLAASPFDLLVIDPSGDERDWTAQEIASLRDGPCGPRIVLAYLSIGEAEDYRWYWDGLPRDLLAAENPHWKGNFGVRYWDARWRAVLFGVTTGPSKSSLDRILDAGFDGVYLDIVDAYESWGPVAVGGSGERPAAARDMIDLVAAIAAYARETRGRTGFLVVPQNGSGITSEDAQSWAADPAAEADAARTRWLATIDGAGAEDTFFYGRRAMDNPWRPQKDVIAQLDALHAAGRTILAIDYVSRRAKVRRFYAACAAHGFVPLASNRALTRLRVPRGAPRTPCR